MNIESSPSPSMMKLFRVIPWMALILTMVSVLASLYLESEIANELNQVKKSQYLSDTLRQSSDDLTRMVRTYAVTGDPVYKSHFQEILDIRDGRKPRPDNLNAVYWDLVLADGSRPMLATQSIALMDLVREANLSETQVQLLMQAKLASDELAILEQKAIGIIDQNPVTAQQQEVIDLLFNEEYHSKKAQIMQYIADYQRNLELSSSNKLESYEKWVFASHVGMVVFALVGMLSLALSNLNFSRNNHSLKDELRQKDDDLLSAKQESQQKQQDFELLFEASSDGILLMNERGITNCNASALKMFGLQGVHDILGLKLLHLSPTSQRSNSLSSELLAEYMALAERNSNAFFEWYFKRLDVGSSFVTEVLLTHSKAHHNQYQLVIRDISFRKMQERALNESQSRYESLIEDIGNEYVIFSYRSETGVLSFLSQGFTAVFGVDREQVIGIDWRHAIEWVDDSIERSNAALEAIISNKSGSAELEMSFRHPSGEIRTVNIIHHLRWVEDINVTFIEGIARNITDQKNMEKQLLELRQANNQHNA